MHMALVESLKLIYNYLKERKQQVKINAEYSSWEEILNGVPQGSVVGHYYLIYL